MGVCGGSYYFHFTHFSSFNTAGFAYRTCHRNVSLVINLYFTFLRASVITMVRSSTANPKIPYNLLHNP